MDVQDFEAHRPHLHAVATRILGSRAEADDALQEAWIRKFWPLPWPNYDPADYETVFELVERIRARTGVNYRIAYADAPYTAREMRRVMVTTTISEVRTA